jgi:kinesin family protein 13
VVKIDPVETGNLPLVVQRIQSIWIGCICPRSRSLQKGLDSYQEEDLTVVKERWSDALAKRQEYLYDQIQSLMQKPDKMEADSERENALIVEWLGMNEERAAVLVPTPNSGVPGAPADW